jgi:hypothetical protein
MMPIEVARSGARAAGEDEREVPHHRRGGSHENRAQAGARGFDDCAELVGALLLQLVGELDDEDPVLGYQADERDQADLAVDVQRRESEEREEQRAGDRQRNRSGEDDEGIAEALELRREDEVDQDRGKQEGPEELPSLRAKLRDSPA